MVDGVGAFEATDDGVGASSVTVEGVGAPTVDGVGASNATVDGVEALGDDSVRSVSGVGASAGLANCAVDGPKSVGEEPYSTRGTVKGVGASNVDSGVAPLELDALVSQYAIRSVADVMPDAKVGDTESGTTDGCRGGWALGGGGVQPGVETSSMSVPAGESVPGWLLSVPDLTAFMTATLPLLVLLASFLLPLDVTLAAC